MEFPDLRNVDLEDITVTYRRSKGEWECQIWGPSNNNFYGEGLADSLGDAVEAAVIDALDDIEKMSVPVSEIT